MKYLLLLPLLSLILLASCDSGGSSGNSGLYTTPSPTTESIFDVTTPTIAAEEEEAGFSTPPPPPVGGSEGPGGLVEITPRRADQPVEDTLRQIEGDVGFPLAAPTRIPSLWRYRVALFGEGSDATVTVDFEDPGDFHRSLAFEQAARPLGGPLPCPGSPGYIPPPEFPTVVPFPGMPPLPMAPTRNPADCSSEQITIQGVSANLQRDRNPIDNSRLIIINWQQGQVWYEVSASNLEEEEVIGIATSVQPIR